MKEEVQKSEVHTRKMDAYRDILRYIAEQNLKPGDLLPPQAALGKLLHTCQATLQSAMDFLAEDGVLERRRKVGTVLCMPFPVVPKREVWRVGLVMPPLEGSLFFPLLTTRLHRCLSLHSVLDRTYFISQHAGEQTPQGTRQISDFSGLASDIEGQLLDAIITPTRLESDQLPVIHVGSLWSPANMGVFFDEDYFLKDSVEFLVKQEKKDILCVFHHKLSKGHPNLENEFSSLRKECISRGLALEAIELANKEEAGVVLARRIFERASLPDGVVIANDMTAMQFCETILTTSYRPAIVVASNLEIPLSFALPVYRMAFNIENMSVEAVQMTLAHLQRPSLPRQQVFVRHSLVEPNNRI
jgi:hypothetical protein